MKEEEEELILFRKPGTSTTLESLKILAVNFWKSPHGICRRTAAQSLELDI